MQLRALISQVISWATVIGLIPVVIAILCSGYITYRYNLVLNETRSIVRHSLEVTTAINDVMLDLQDLETGQRGYLITGEADYLQPFDAAREAFAGHLATLRSLVSDNPAQSESTNEIARLAGEKLDELEATIRVRRVDGFAAAQAIVAGDAGKTTMDEIRRYVDVMQSYESDLLADNARRLEQTEHRVIWVVGTTIALALTGRLVGIVLLSWWRSRKAERTEA